jgi:uncharacterized protein YbjT (DUF2867 family)
VRAGSGEFEVVTGAFGYTGKYITRRLLAAGKRIKTLTGHPQLPDPFSGRVTVARWDFDDMSGLRRELEGASVLYNTYWVRFEHGAATFAKAIANTRKLIRAAAEAGVRRLVHVSIANPSLDSTLPYYRGKAELEAAIQQSELSYAILRPTVIFGLEDILINNIAWLVRSFPIFAVPGDGSYQLQPIFVDDVAVLAAAAGDEYENCILDAAGPETFTFDELVLEIAKRVRKRVKLWHVHPDASLVATKIIGACLHDVILTRAEIKGLMANLLVSSSPPLGATRFTEWLRENAPHLGSRYASELARHYR